MTNKHNYFTHSRTNILKNMKNICQIARDSGTHSSAHWQFSNATDTKWVGVRCTETKKQKKYKNTPPDRTNTNARSMTLHNKNQYYDHTNCFESDNNSRLFCSKLREGRRSIRTHSQITFDAFIHRHADCRHQMTPTMCACPLLHIFHQFNLKLITGQNYSVGNAK